METYRVSDNRHKCANEENTKLCQAARSKCATLQLTRVLQHIKKKQLETKAMPTSTQCNTGRTCFPLPITTTEKTSLPIHIVQKITIMRAQKIGKSAV